MDIETNNGNIHTKNQSHAFTLYWPLAIYNNDLTLENECWSFGRNENVGHGKLIYKQFYENGDKFVQVV